MKGVFRYWTKTSIILIHILMQRNQNLLSLIKKQIQNYQTPEFFELRLFKPLLNRPQGCQGRQKNRKDLRITTMIRFCISFQPKLKKFRKTFKINKKSSKNNVFW